jgi:predicted nucleic acid-binding protein
VFGGCFDREFQKASRQFFDLVEQGGIVLLLSELVRAELVDAPAQVAALLESIPRQAVENIPIGDEVLVLRDAYLAAGVVGRKSSDDAAHVATATVARADAIVSWNLKGIVGLGRIRGYNHVNLRLGYGMLTILTPQGVLLDDEA